MATESRLKVGSLVAGTIVLSALLLLHVQGVNGPSYWYWPWRRLAALPVYGCMALASMPFFIAQWIDRPTRLARAVAIALLMSSALSLMVVSAMVIDNPPSFEPIVRIVNHPLATGYFLDAQEIMNIPLKTWIHDFPKLAPRMHMHTWTKPPGPVLYWLLFIKLFGVTSRAAIIGAIVLGFLGALSIPATYLFLRNMLGDATAAFCGASFMSLCPGFVLFFPMFDPALAILTCAMVGFWLAALRRNQIRWAIASGFILGMLGLLTYTVLGCGVFMAALPFFTGNRPLKNRLGVYAKLSIATMTTALVVLLALRVILEFDAYLTFLGANENQNWFKRNFPDQRPYPQIVPFMLTEFALTTGWISVLLVIYYFLGRDGTSATVSGGPSRRTLAWLVVLQFLAAAISGVYPLETARIWDFMLPFLAIPVGMELARWSKTNRVIAYASLLIVTMVICQNLLFVAST
ncbi:MAG TPA: hypothetical protein VHD56_12915 [Tepidisphaeraceae bacterium]|nr:hypothetical protein [Tepidisphaeraceae bacterium]